MLPCSSSHASISEKISAPIFNYLKSDSDWSIVNAPFEKTLTTEYLPNNNRTTKMIAADTPYTDSWLEELRSVDVKRSKVICRAVHDATLNNTTRELKISVVSLYFFITDSNC
jgi:hypothetical protein